MPADHTEVKCKGLHSYNLHLIHLLIHSHTNTHHFTFHTDLALYTKYTWCLKNETHTAFQ